jgi:hypothetical protein
MMAAVISLPIHLHRRAAGRFHPLRHHGLRGDYRDGDRRRGHQANQKSQERSHWEDNIGTEGQFNNFSGRPISAEENRAPRPRAAVPGLLFSLPSPEQSRNWRYSDQRAYIELCVRSVVVVVSAEAAHPEIKTAVRASAAKATSLFLIAVSSELAGRADGPGPAGASIVSPP